MLLLQRQLLETSISIHYIVMNKVESKHAVDSLWLSVSERQPESSVLVWVWDKDGLNMGAAETLAGDLLWKNTNGRLPQLNNGKFEAALFACESPSYWMPLPTPPGTGSEWVKVSDAVPQTMRLVITSNFEQICFGIGCLAYLEGDGEAQWWESGGYIPRWDGEMYDCDLDVGYEPTHWLPLPTPPLS
jgi:hypothetical protein